MSTTTNPTLIRLWQNRHDRSLGIHQWFTSLLAYSSVLMSILLLVNLYFVTSTNLYKFGERLALVIPALFLYTKYILLVLAGLTKPYTQKQQYMMVVLGSVAVILHTAVLFSLVAENLVLLQLQQEMTDEDAFLQLALHHKASLLFDFILENGFAKWVSAFVGILLLLLHFFPAAVLFIFHQSGRKAAFLEYLNLRKIAYEGK